MTEQRYLCGILDDGYEWRNMTKELGRIVRIELGGHISQLEVEDIKEMIEKQKEISRRKGRVVIWPPEDWER